MYRFSIKEEEWILRFSPQLFVEEEEKEVIISSISQVENELANSRHGSSFIIFSKESGAIVFEVERVPSFILTISSIVPEENWFLIEE